MRHHDQLVMKCVKDGCGKDAQPNSNFCAEHFKALTDFSDIEAELKKNPPGWDDSVTRSLKPLPWYWQVVRYAGYLNIPVVLFMIACYGCELYDFRGPVHIVVTIAVFVTAVCGILWRRKEKSWLKGW